MMFRFLIIFLLTIGISANELLAQISIDFTLINDLTKMVIIDQVAATNATPKGQFADLKLEEWNAKVVLARLQSRCSGILDKG